VVLQTRCWYSLPMARDERKVSKRSQSTPSSFVPSREPPLSPQRAFVVQFREGPAPWAGRVEHTVSGRAARFQSAEELWAFLTQIVGGEEKKAP
jgi:hypothetical protein